MKLDGTDGCRLDLGGCTYPIDRSDGRIPEMVFLFCFGDWTGIYLGRDHMAGTLGGQGQGVS